MVLRRCSWSPLSRRLTMRPDMWWWCCVFELLEGRPTVIGWPSRDTNRAERDVSSWGWSRVVVDASEMRRVPKRGVAIRLGCRTGDRLAVDY